jgi:uroporphyrin-III C-methyltransferase
MPLESKGCVKLVGAGPGAADLLTVRALRAMESADVILIDALVSAEIRACIPAHVRIIEVGKRGHRPSTPQDFINRLMARLALGGSNVVRLKSGDPSVFGRAGEERLFLEARGVSVEVIAGITTASAAAAQFGFSLTSRGEARRVLFATGRTLGGPECDWRSAADPETTLCLYMGCADLALICVALIAAGRDARTPAAALINVERPEARMIRSSLGRLSSEIAAAEGAPVLIVIGEACAPASIQAAERMSA